MKYCFVLILPVVLFLSGCSKPTGYAVSAEAPKETASPKIAENKSQTFEGAINNKFKIRMMLRRVGKELSGNYHYTAHRIDLSLKGTVDENNNLVLNEFDSEGNKTGVFKGRFLSSSEMNGTWSKPDGGRELPFSLTALTAQAAAAKPAKPSEEEDFSEENDDTGPNPGTGNLDSEAIAQFQQLWSSTYTDCRDGSFVTRTQSGLMKQVRNVSFIVQPRPITEADRLNDVQWKGAVRAKYSSERNWNSSWGDWKTAHEQPFMTFEKRNSRWKSPAGIAWRYQKAPCP